MMDVLKGETEKQLVLWMRDTGAATHMFHVRKRHIHIERIDVKAQFGRSGDMKNVDAVGSWKGQNHGKNLKP